MNDLISRQAAIDTIFKTCRRTCTLSHALEKAFEKLPSAEPEIIRCKDCKWFVDNDPDNAQGMCDNAKGWVVATSYDFGCIYAERKDNG